MESQLQPQPQPQPQQPASTADEEAVKRNTDCVYFLASPLTCKKGSECEYRHSDVARLNPRDCWFWLNGNCLNAKCSFRHPPLDGLMGTQIPTSTGTPQPPSQTVSVPGAHVPNVPSKQPVPCIFFQKGFCLKGDWCPFLHGPSSINRKSSFMPEGTSAAEPANLKKPVGGVDKSTPEKKVPPVVVAKPVKVSPQSKPAIKMERDLPRKEFSVNKTTPHSSGIHDFPGYRNISSATNGNPRVQQSPLLDEPGSMNSKDVEEFSRDPSPGFDVLVDDERGDSDYYPGEDQYGMHREHEARNEYDMGHSTDYGTIADIDNERYQDPLTYGSHEHFKGQYAWEHGVSSERISGGSSYLERRPLARTDSRGQVDESDLRHRLAKHKRANGLRSVITHEHVRDRHPEDRQRQGFRRDDQYSSRHENPLSSRLHGRIRLPGRSSSPPNDRRVTRSSERGRLSPGRVPLSSRQGRIQDRIKGRVEEAFSIGGNNHKVPHVRRDIMNDDYGNFAGPKSLTELKSKKNGEQTGYHMTDLQSHGKRKHFMPDTHQQSGNSLSFEGPKPLHEILKRKRGETTPSGGNSSNNGNTFEDNNQAANNTVITPIGYNDEVDNSVSIDKTGAEENNPAGLNSTLQVEDGVDQEDEAYDQRNGESDYEQEGGEEFDMYEGENGDAEGEDYHEEDEDDDDFAKKMGVICS